VGSIPTRGTGSDIYESMENTRLDCSNHCSIVASKFGPLIRRDVVVTCNLAKVVSPVQIRSSGPVDKAGLL
jgi:hypothetical protein